MPRMKNRECPNQTVSMAVKRCSSGCRCSRDVLSFYVALVTAQKKIAPLLRDWDSLPSMRPPSPSRSSPSRGPWQCFKLICSLCQYEWGFRRGRCAACGEGDERNLAYYTAPGFEHLRVQACDTCRQYIHSIDFARDSNALPEVDEMAALPLDVWARERGYKKIQPNFAGI